MGVANRSLLAMAMLRAIALAAALLATSVKSEPLFGWLLPWNTDNSTTESPDTSTVEPVFKTSDYVPYLAEEDFACAELVDDRALAESLSDDDNGGPLMSNGTLDEIDNRYWQLWKNGEIPYTLASGFGPNDRAQIAKAVKYLERVSCLRFKGVGFDAPKKPRMDFIAASGSTCYCSWSGGKKINAQINLQASPVQAVECEIGVSIIEGHRISEEAVPKLLSCRLSFYVLTYQYHSNECKPLPRWLPMKNYTSMC